MKTFLMQERALCLGVICGLALLAGPVDGAVLNVQILGHGGDSKGVTDPQPPVYHGAGVIGAAGDCWNGVKADSFGHPLTINPPVKMVAADGKTLTDVTLIFNGFVAADHWPVSQGAPIANDLMNSYLTCGAGASVVIENLVPSASYNLYLFGNNSHAGAGTKFAVNGGTPQSTQGTDGSVFTRGVDYVEFKGVSADKEGRIRVALDPTKDEIGIFNGLQLRGELPPPSLESRRQAVANIGRVMDQRVKFITHPMISFRYGGKKFVELPGNWKKNSESHKLDANRTAHRATWADPKTGLEVRVAGIEYRDYPAVEWTVYFKNTGTNNTPTLKDIQALDVIFERGKEGEFVLNGIKGDFMTADSFEPYQLKLGPDVAKTFSPPYYSGKSCDGPDGWPYFNLQMPGGGVILAVGWPGQWASSFARDAAAGLKIRAGQQLTRLYLKPGEEIRTPLIAMLFWRGKDFVTGQNLWRRWYMAHTIPRMNGKPQPPVMQIQVMGSMEDISNVKAFLEAGIKPDVCWRDAAGLGGIPWYPSDTGPFKGADALLNTGTWEIDTRHYPQGFRPFSDWVRERGMQFLLWFEPERVGAPDSWLGKNHPEWLLTGSSATGGSLLDEGNPAAWNWLTDRVDGLIKSQGLDWYREDMNGLGNVAAWRKNDADDRQGITENLYVQGHLAYWDELKRRNPHLRIDSCASGGRRNDLESMRRAVPLLRSDFQFPDMKGVVEGNQGHTYGLSSWLPFQGTGCYLYEPYAYRSFYLPSFGMGALTPENTAAQQKAYAECRRIAPLMLEGDYYPLTPYSLAPDTWIAWQFHRPEQGDGVIQAFRRKNCTAAALALKLQGLEPKAVYTLKNFDGGTGAKTGSDLMNVGLTVAISDAPGSAIVTYAKQ